MAYDYASLRDNVAFPLIERFGAPVSLLRKRDTAEIQKKYDPATKSFYWIDIVTLEIFTEEPEAYSIEYQGYAVLTKYRNEEIDGTTVKRGDIKLIAIGIPLPLLGDVFTVNGTRYNYIYCDPVSPGAVDIVYKIQVRI